MGGESFFAYIHQKIIKLLFSDYYFVNVFLTHSFKILYVFILFYFRIYINLVGKGILNKFTCFIPEHHVICLKTISGMTLKAATRPPTECQQWLIGNQWRLETQKVPWHVCRLQFYWYCFVIYTANNSIIYIFYQQN